MVHDSDLTSRVSVQDPERRLPGERIQRGLPIFIFPREFHRCRRLAGRVAHGPSTPRTWISLLFTCLPSPGNSRQQKDWLLPFFVSVRGSVRIGQRLPGRRTAASSLAPCVCPNYLQWWKSAQTGRGRRGSVAASAVLCQNQATIDRSPSGDER